MKLVEFPFVVVRVGCNLCKRKGAYRLARLAFAYGPEVEMDEVLGKLAKRCPWRTKPGAREGNQYHPKCHAHFVDLADRTPPDMPPCSGGLRVVGGTDEAA